MTPAFKDNVAQPLPGLPLRTVCPRAGVMNPVAYNAIEADNSLTAVEITPGDDMYVLATTDIESGDLAAVVTPEGIFVRFVHWRSDSSGKVIVRLENANPEMVPRSSDYDYDDNMVRTRWRVVWVCRHGDHSRCSAYRRTERAIY